MLLTYGMPVVISNFGPTSGPIAGSTRVVTSGMMFEHGIVYSCSFGQRKVSAVYSGKSGEVVCMTPPDQVDGNVTFGISLDGVNVAIAHRNFSFYSSVAVALDPAGGPVYGGTLLAITGQHFEGDVRARSLDLRFVI